MTKTKWGLFEAYGIELEYMIVDKDSLKVLPLCENLFREKTGQLQNEVIGPAISWSNELVSHVVELKSTQPGSNLMQSQHDFHASVQEVNQILQQFGACLLPGAAHPFMDPKKEGVLWPHGNQEIYHAYDKLFDCKGHGWVNLQSTHINLPFKNEEEFGRLHAAIRLALPLIPALAASSPYLDAQKQDWTDARIHFYQNNQKRIPIITGKIIQEQLYTQKDYENNIYNRIEEAIRPLDPDHILEAQWLNSRGAIAKFDLGAIEIRVMDIQECPLADHAIISFIAALLKKWTQQADDFQRAIRSIHEDDLLGLFLEAAQHGGNAKIHHQEYLALLGYSKKQAPTFRELLHSLKDQLEKEEKLPQPFDQVIEFILAKGSLSERLISQVGDQPHHQTLMRSYQQLCHCLENNQLFDPEV